MPNKKMVDKSKLECDWAQQIVNEWAKNMLMPTGPTVAFVETIAYVDDEEGVQYEDYIAAYGGDYIFIKPSEWYCRDNFWRLFILGHEFVHWLQNKRRSDTKERAVEREAYELGLELARRQIAQWRHRPKLPLQLELPFKCR